MNSRIRPFGISDKTMTAAPDRAQGRGYRGDEIKFFTIPQIAEQLNVADRTVRRWIAKRHLTAHRFGGVVRIAERDLLAFLSVSRES